MHTSLHTWINLMYTINVILLLWQDSCYARQLESIKCTVLNIIVYIKWRMMTQHQVCLRPRMTCLRTVSLVNSDGCRL